MNSFTRVKLMDFGMTKKSGTMVRKVSTGIPYTPPEICEALKGERYTVDTSADVWGFGVLLFCALTGNFPWELAHHRDAFFVEFSQWQKRKTTKIPSQWRRFSPRMMRFFRRLLEVKPERRCGIKETFKYLDDTWLQIPKSSPENTSETAEEGSSDPMDELSAMLEQHGIETKVNRKFRERRISEWLLHSTWLYGSVKQWVVGYYGDLDAVPQDREILMSLAVTVLAVFLVLLTLGCVSIPEGHLDSLDMDVGIG